MRTHDVICVEDLSIKAMAKNRRLSRSVHDQAMGQFLRVLAEKAARRGRLFAKVGRAYASTQICSACQAATGPKGQDQLGVRHWTCAECGASHDRDENAAANILAEGLRLLGISEPHHLVAVGRTETQNACGADVSDPEMGPAGVEAGRAAKATTCLAT